jgi:hypothetical protein
MIEKETHEEWKTYLASGGSLSQGSFMYVKTQLPTVRRHITTSYPEGAMRACEALPPLNGKYQVYDTYCAAFQIISSSDGLTSTLGEPVRWHSEEWFSREAALITNDPLTKLITQAIF